MTTPIRPQPITHKQVALFVYLSKILWQLGCRIPWASLDRHDKLHVQAIQPMLERAAAKARNATTKPRKHRR